MTIQHPVRSFVITWIFVFALLLDSFGQQISYAFNSGGVAAPTLVHVLGCSGTSTPDTCAITAATAGDTLVDIAVANGGTCTSVTSTPSNTFQLWGNSITGSNRHSIFVARNVAASTTSLVATCAGASSFVSQMVYEVSCPATTTAAGDVAGFTTGSGGTPTFTTVNPVGSSAEEVIGSIFDNSNFRTWVAGSGYTLQATVNASGATHLGATVDNNVKTGLSGTQSASITGVSTDGWTGSIIGLACSPAQDNADTIVTFEGLSNTVNPTVTQLNNSTFGVPLTWSLADAGTVFTGATGSALALINSHQIGATAYQSGQTLGLAYNLIGGSTTYHLLGTFPQAYSTVSYLVPFYTTIPQNDTNLNAYTWDQFNDTSGAGDYASPQLQANGSSLVMAFECPSATGSGTIPISTSTLYYLQNTAVSGGGAGSITSFTGTSGTLTFTNSGTNGFFSGESITLSGFSGGNTGLNAQVVTVLSAGLSATTFEATVTGSGYSSGTGAAIGNDTLRIYNSSGSQVGSTITCQAHTGTLQWSNLGVGINGAEPTATGAVISQDNIRISYQGLALTP